MFKLAVEAMRGQENDRWRKVRIMLLYAFKNFKGLQENMTLSLEHGSLYF